MFGEIYSDDDDLEVIVGDCSPSKNSKAQNSNKQNDSDDDLLFIGIKENKGNNENVPKFKNSFNDDVVFLGAKPRKPLVSFTTQPVLERTSTKKECNITKHYSIVDPRLETLDPTPNIQLLFEDFDQKFFDGLLRSCRNLKVAWSSRLTASAGLFSVARDRRTGVISAKIHLSSKLLSLRPRSDLVQTLLHEMIHAYIYFNRIRDNGSHGDWFKRLMRQINSAAGTNITVYHTFNNEVQYVKRQQGTSSTPFQSNIPS